MKYDKMTLVSDAHCNRTVGGVITNDSYELIKFIEDGFSIQEISYTLRYPEVMVYDLSNLEYPLNRCDNTTIINCFEYIDLHIDKELKENGLSRIRGDKLYPEIAISGSNKENLNKFKQRFLNKVYERFNVYNHMCLEEINARGIYPTEEINDITTLSKKNLNIIQNEYKKYVKKENYSDVKTLNCKYIYPNHRIWKDLQKISKSKLFILNAGLPLGISYINYTDDDEIHFSEVHRQNDPYSRYKIREFNEIFPSIAEDNSVTIIDKMYTGGSINEVFDKLQNKIVLKIGLFPKSFSHLCTVDYVVYAGRLIKSIDIIEKCSEENWHKKALYLAIEQGDKNCSTR